MSAKLKNKGVVPSITVPDGGKWATTARNAAAELLTETGLPHRRDEYWKYTDPTTLTAPEATPAAIFKSDDPLPFSGVDAVKIVFVDGIYDPSQSDALELAGVEIETLADAAQKDIHWAGSVFGVLEGRGQSPVSRPLASYNTAMAEQGFVIRATGKAAKPVSFIYLHESETSDAVIHHTIKLDEGADLTVLENGPAAARINAVMEVEVADNAAFHHVRAQGRDHERRTATHIFARLGAESSFKSFTLTVNGVLTRNDAIIEFTGDNAHATVAGACAGDGAFHHDDTVFITHDAVNCESRQVFKKVLRNGAVGVFQGKILVQPDAQKTDGYQISQGLMLDENSTFQAKPELEIYADDVACSHGSTVGAIDETALFYLTSRGIPHKEAQDMLTLAFLGEAIDEVEDDALADDLRSLLQGWMARRHG
ncbi:MAG: SufD family Fe-S cluster assembly protein [Rhodobacteraceae bacterium]|nr:SufD family Fe-S cluster assembly protein [Paracoccaceae bacterium]